MSRIDVKRIRKRLGSIPKVVWLMIILSATLLMPFCASGKYRSNFSKTVDIVVYPAMTLEGVPEDGALINDIVMMQCSTPSSCTPSSCAPSSSMPSSCTPSSNPSSSSTPSQATYSQEITATTPETATSSQVEPSISPENQPENTSQASFLDIPATSLCTPSDIINTNN